MDWKKKTVTPSDESDSDIEAELYMREAGDHEYAAMKEVGGK